jgi:DEAD/DEAH box helicase domain-containing protein
MVLQNSKERSLVDHIFSQWQADPVLGETIQHWVTQPARDPIFTDLPDDLNGILKSALQNLGINQLYSHQLEAWKAVSQGENIVITTGTSSGKSLCYQLPVLQAASLSENPTTLFIFPTKALAQDQLQSLQRLIVSMERVCIDDGTPKIITGIYDGDTPPTQRQQIRSKVRLLITNPDMLHMAMLPHHTLWEQFFRNLRYVVLDEIHTYRGVFGANIINVIRRLKRICNFYGTHPQFIMTSATIANPVEHASNLIEENVHWISKNGSPQGKKFFLMINPPIIQHDLGIRQNPAVECIRFTSDLLAYGQQILIFMKTRRSVEILYRQLHTLFPDVNIHGYRSGYLPAERRAIERQLRSGETRAVVATNALELGIDIGGINAVLMVGYPGTIAATVQQSGRAGRKNEAALAALIASQFPLDQYLMKHPEFLLDRSPENARCDPNNLLILLGHLRCAAFELPFHDGEHFGNVPDTLMQGLMMFLVKDKQVYNNSNTYYWTADKYPADGLNLRTSAGSIVSLKIQDGDRFLSIGIVDAPSAIWMVHPDAVYLHQGESYLVRELDLEKGQALLEPVSLDYYTEPRNEIKIEYANPVHETRSVDINRFYGDIRVVNKVIGYKKIRWSNNEILSTHDLDLPPNTLDTTGYWLTLGKKVVDTLRELDSWSGDENQYGPDWKNIRLAILQRDNFTCTLCGSSGTNQTLHIHHKTPFKTFASYQEANMPGNLITLCPACHRRVEMIVRTRTGLSGLRYVLLNLAPLFVMCDPTDLGSFADPKAEFAEGQPAVMIYDQTPGGIGLSQSLYQYHSDLIKSSLELVQHCTCEDGCPGCVGPAGENGAGGKKETLALLKAMAGDHG